MSSFPGDPVLLFILTHHLSQETKGVHAMFHDLALKAVISHIETHLEDSLNTEQLARIAGYDDGYFHRYKMAALDLGYATHGGFLRAFKRIYGQPPTRYAGNIGQQGGITMNVQIVSKPAFNVAGYGVSTNIAGSFTQEVAAFWDKYEENWEGKLYEKLNPPRHGEVCICLPESRNGSNLLYVMGVIVDDFSKVEPDMYTVTVPEATYTVFTTPSVNQVGGINEDLFIQGIRETWRKVYTEWFDASGYIYDENGLDFEYYDERCHHTPHSVMDIHVPVRKK